MNEMYSNVCRDEKLKRLNSPNKVQQEEDDVDDGDDDVEENEKKRR